MLREQRLRRGQRREFVERLAAQRLGLGGQSAPLLVGEAETPSAESFSADTVLLAQVIDRRLLLAIHPAGEGEEEEVARVQAAERPGILRADEFSDASPSGVVLGARISSTTFWMPSMSSTSDALHGWPGGNTSAA